MIIDKIREKQKEFSFFHGVAKTLYVGKKEYKEITDFGDEMIKFKEEWEKLFNDHNYFLKQTLEPLIKKAAVEQIMGLRIIKCEEESYLELGL